MRRGDIALADVPGLKPDARLELAGSLLGLRGIGTLLRIQQALVVFVGEFGVNRQPQRRAIVALAGQADGKVHRVAGLRMHWHLLGVLVGGKHLLQQSAQLGFAKHAAHFHVGEQALEVAHALRKRLHFAQATVHHFQPVGHLLEAFAQPRLQGGLQFFVYRVAHLVKLGAVALLQLRHLFLQCAAHFGQAAGVGLAQGG